MSDRELNRLLDDIARTPGVLARFVGGPLDGIERVMEDARVEWHFRLRSLPAPLPVDDEREERSVVYRRGDLTEAIAEDGAVLYSLIDAEFANRTPASDEEEVQGKPRQAMNSPDGYSGGTHG
jgi:hypothetical protein